MKVTRDYALRILKASGAHPRVIRHCLAVEKKAIELAEGTGADMELVRAGAILHDLGRSLVHGVSHGVVGAEIARGLGLDKRIVNIIERHVGSGIPKKEAVLLGLPARDLLPVTLEEKIVNHADNFVHEEKIGSFGEALRSFEKKFGKGSDVVKRLKQHHFELTRKKVSLDSAHYLLYPRPVVLISTKDNVAPFSFVMPVSIEPPMLAFACYTEHDTYRNIVKGKEFVVNVMPPEFAEKVLVCGREVGPEVNEFKLSGLTEVDSSVVSVPSVEEALASIECRLAWKKMAGEDCIFVGKVVAANAKGVAGKIDIRKVLLQAGNKRFSFSGPAFSVEK